MRLLTYASIAFFFVLFPMNKVLAEKTFMEHPLSAEKIKKAIQQGARKKPNILHINQINVLVASGGYKLTIYTPTTWIMQESYNRANKYLQLTPDDIDADMEKGVLRVICNPSTENGIIDEPYSAEHLVILSTNKNKPDVLQPISVKLIPKTYQNVFGATTVLNAVHAEFILEDIRKISSKDKNKEFIIEAIHEKAYLRHKFRIRKKHQKKLP